MSSLENCLLESTAYFSIRLMHFFFCYLVTGILYIFWRLTSYFICSFQILFLLLPFYWQLFFFFFFIWSAESFFFYVVSLIYFSYCCLHFCCHIMKSLPNLERERQLLYDISYICNLNNTQMSLYAKQKQTYRHREQICECSQGQRGEW